MTSSDKSVLEFHGDHLRRVWSSEGHLVKTEEYSALRTLAQHLQGAFIPADKTSDDYLRFQVWDSLQGLCSYIRGMLSSQAVLKGILAEDSAPQTAAGSAMYTYFMRDLSGMIGGIAFAATQGSGMDSYAKQWRIFADCFNNVGYILELISPVFPEYFLFLACLGSVARAITGVAAGATRSALTYHFARGGNAGDISAKEGSQETAVTLVGMSVGMAVVHLTGGSPMLTWITFLVLTVLHIFANIKAMRSLNLASLNRPRLDLLLEHYANCEKCLSIPEVAKAESLIAPPLQAWLSWIRRAKTLSITLGACMSDLDDKGREALRRKSEAAYFCWPQRVGHVSVVVHPDASKEDLLQAYIEAWTLGAQQMKLSSHGRIDNKLKEQQRVKVTIAEMAEAGWEVNSASLGETKWRVAWGADLHRE